MIRRRLALNVLGVVLVLGLWALAGLALARHPAFAGFGPGPTLAALGHLLASGEVVRMIGPSLLRIGGGLGWAIAIGVPAGILIGSSPVAAALTHLPFQFLRMISPLAWMPIAVLAFSSWDSAIIFLIAAAAVWPVTFATAAGVRKIDPHWFKVARNLGAGPWHLLTTVILPAVGQDILTGIRLALGVAWIVLVPGEFLGVTSGLGYAINDARDILEYDRLAATVLVIGAIGFALDALCLMAIRRAAWQLAS